MRYNFIDLVLLSFDFIVGSSIGLECSFHILDDTVLGMQSVVSKLFPIVFFCLEALPYHFLFHSEPICLLIIHILYELLSGRRAFQGDSAVETLNAILTMEPPALSSERSATRCGSRARSGT